MRANGSSRRTPIVTSTREETSYRSRADTGERPRATTIRSMREGVNVPTNTAEPRVTQNELALLMRATEALLLAAYDERAVLATAANLLGERFGYSTRSILLYQKGADELVMAYASGPGADDPDVLAWRRKLGEGLSGVAAKTRKIVNVGDLRADARTIRISRGQTS